ncbi:MAG TPA: hypothetical protein PKY30_08140 [Myxococcota bacterium]|nr:hypothetical protein [Myxococcota bacterium]HNH46992.1 hypothetical protein [Myxococcota bacterium]
MQQELLVDRPDLQISLLAVNEAGHESGNYLIPDIGSLPMVQDDSTALVWSNWGAVWRDVIVLDQENRPVLTYNLTTYNLATPENYDLLKAELIRIAEGR